MSQDHHADKNSPSESKSEREILELRVDSKLTEAKEALRDFNKAELQRIAGNIPGICNRLIVGGHKTARTIQTGPMTNMEKHMRHSRPRITRMHSQIFCLFSPLIQRQMKVGRWQ